MLRVHTHRAEMEEKRDSNQSMAVAASTSRALAMRMRPTTNQQACMVSLCAGASNYSDAQRLRRLVVWCPGTLIELITRCARPQTCARALCATFCGGVAAVTARNKYVVPLCHEILFWHWWCWRAWRAGDMARHNDDSGRQEIDAAKRDHGPNIVNVGASSIESLNGFRRHNCDRLMARTVCSILDRWSAGNERQMARNNLDVSSKCVCVSVLNTIITTRGQWPNNLLWLESKHNGQHRNHSNVLQLTLEVLLPLEHMRRGLDWIVCLKCGCGIG